MNRHSVFLLTIAWICFGWTEAASAFTNCWTGAPSASNTASCTVEASDAVNAWSGAAPRASDAGAHTVSIFGDGTFDIEICQNASDTATCVVAEADVAGPSVDTVIITGAQDRYIRIQVKVQSTGDTEIVVGGSLNTARQGGGVGGGVHPVNLTTDVTGALDAITDLDASIKTGTVATKVVTGAEGLTDECAKWDGNGDLVSAGAACGGGATTRIAVVCQDEVGMVFGEQCLAADGSRGEFTCVDAAGCNGPADADIVENYATNFQNAADLDAAGDVANDSHTHVEANVTDLSHFSPNATTATDHTNFAGEVGTIIGVHAAITDAHQLPTILATNIGATGCRETVLAAGQNCISTDGKRTLWMCTDATGCGPPNDSDTLQVATAGMQTDHGVARGDGTTGGIQDSGVTISDTDVLDVPGSVTVTGAVTTSSLDAPEIDEDADGNPEITIDGTSIVFDVDSNGQPDHTFIATTNWDVNRDISGDTNCDQIIADLEPLLRRTGSALDGFYARWTGTLTLTPGDFPNIPVNDGAGGDVVGPIAACWPIVPTAVDYDVLSTPKYPVIDGTTHSDTPGVLFWDNVVVELDDCNITDHPAETVGEEYVDLSVVMLGGAYQSGSTTGGFGDPPELHGNIRFDALDACNSTWGPLATVAPTGNPAFVDVGVASTTPGSLLGHSQGTIGLFFNGWWRGINKLTFNMETGIDKGFHGIVQGESWGTPINQPRIKGTDVGFWKYNGGETSLNDVYIRSNRIGLQIGNGSATTGNCTAFWHDGVDTVCPGGHATQCAATCASNAPNGSGIGMKIRGGVIEGNGYGNIADFAGGNYVVDGLDMEMSLTPGNHGIVLGAGICAAGDRDDMHCARDWDCPGSTCSVPTNPAYLQASYINMAGVDGGNLAWHSLAIGPGAVGADSATDPDVGFVTLGGQWSGGRGDELDLGTEDVGGTSTTTVTDSSQSWGINQWSGEAVVWTTGDNVQTQYQIDSNDGTTLTLTSAIPTLTIGDDFHIVARTDFTALTAHPDATAVINLADDFFPGAKTGYALGDYAHFSDNNFKILEGYTTGDMDGRCIRRDFQASTTAPCPNAPTLGGVWRLGSASSALSRRWIIHDVIVDAVGNGPNAPDCDVSLISGSSPESSTRRLDVPMYTQTVKHWASNTYRYYVGTDFVADLLDNWIGIEMAEGAVNGCNVSNDAMQIRLFPVWK